MAKGETDTTRQARLAAALRDNLKRRKEQGRARKAAVSDLQAGISSTAAEHDHAPDGQRLNTRVDSHGAGGQRPVKED
ncbi:MULTISPECIES: hypothetical protein [unclassified Chelatococcus]|uniref:hypothetical protein n=1 Tax=unclassified Chelatococcus TaxID=2638111 RepID=UPI001BD0C865|nr:MULTISPECIES: hypothetical protein [unclassified Chelatococcus]MBS7696315.1 hypothetical protein [Chelatococcus sp. YT9]MBX3556925.1 hypothetical protein [Chelatococcus sp.]